MNKRLVYIEISEGTKAEMDALLLEGQKYDDLVREMINKLIDS